MSDWFLHIQIKARNKEEEKRRKVLCVHIFYHQPPHFSSYLPYLSRPIRTTRTMRFKNVSSRTKYNVYLVIARTSSPIVRGSACSKRQNHPTCLAHRSDGMERNQERSMPTVVLGEICVSLVSEFVHNKPVWGWLAGNSQTVRGWFASL